MKLKSKYVPLAMERVMRTVKQMAVFVGIWMCAAIAGANILEHQIEADRFSEIVEQAVRTYPFCPQEIAGSDYIVDRVELSDPVHLRRAAHEQPRNVSTTLGVMTHPVQLVVPVAASLRDIDHTYDPEENGRTDFVLETDAIFHLAFDGAALQINLATTEPDLTALGELFGVDMMALLRSYFSGLRLPMSFDAFSALLPGESRINGTGVTLNSDDYLAMRVEYSEQDCSGDLTVSSGWGSYAAYLAELQRERARCLTPDVTAWIGFHDGIAGPRHSADQWSLFADQLLLRQAIEEQLYPRIAAIPDIALDGRFGSGWTPLGDLGAEIPLNFSGTYTGYFCNITFSADPLIGIHLDESELVVDGAIGEIWRSGGDVAECIFGMTTMFGGAFLPGLNETVASILSAVFYNYEFDMDLSDVSLGRDWDCAGDDASLRCSTSVELPALQATGMPEPLGFLTLDHFSGEVEGLLAGGSIDVVTSEAYGYNVETRPFEFGMSDCCRDLWFAGELLLDGYGTMCGTGPEIIDDSLSAFSLRHITGGWQVRLGLGDWDAFWADPYPARVRVQTSAGTMVFEMSPGEQPAADAFEGWGSACGAERAFCEMRGGLEREREYGLWREPEFRYATDKRHFASNPKSEAKTGPKDTAGKYKIGTKLSTSIVTGAVKATHSTDTRTGLSKTGSAKTGSAKAADASTETADGSAAAMESASRGDATAKALAEK